MVNGAIQLYSPNMPSMNEVEVMREMARSIGYSLLLGSKATEVNNRAGDAFMIMMLGYELGIPPVRALQTIYVVNNKPTMSAQAMLSVALYRGVKVELPDFKDVTDSATVKIQRPGSAEWKEFTYTMAMAGKAQLTNKENWTKYPVEMLVWRAVATGLRFCVPDIIGGLYTPDEIDPNLRVDEEGTPMTITVEREAPAQPKASNPPPAQPKNATRLGKQTLAPADVQVDETGEVVIDGVRESDFLTPEVAQMVEDEKQHYDNGQDDDPSDVDFPEPDEPYTPPVEVKNWGEDPKYKGSYVAWLEQIARKSFQCELPDLVDAIGYKSIDEMLSKYKTSPLISSAVKMAVITEGIFVYVFKVKTIAQGKDKKGRLLTIDFGFAKLELRSRQAFIDAGWMTHEDTTWREPGEHIVNPPIAVQLKEEAGKLAIAYVEAPDFEAAE